MSKIIPQLNILGKCLYVLFRMIYLLPIFVMGVFFIFFVYYALTMPDVLKENGYFALLLFLLSYFVMVIVAEYIVNGFCSYLFVKEIDIQEDSIIIKRGRKSREMPIADIDMRESTFSFEFRYRYVSYAIFKVFYKNDTNLQVLSNYIAGKR